jgi:hypothetical protein
MFRNSKKGQVIDLLGGIQRGISWFLDVTPKPIKIMIFLLFLIGFASIFGFLLNTTGHFCDSQGNLYKTGLFSFKTNFNLLSDMPSNDELISTTIDPDDPAVKATTIVNCNVPVGNGTTYYKEGDNKIYIDEGLYYQSSDRCVDCEFKTIYWEEQGGLLTKTSLCMGDAYAKPYDELSWWGRQTCGKTFGVCTPPAGYYYSKAQGSYVCKEGICEGQTMGTLWNENLKSIGAKIITQETIAEYDYRNAVRVDCDIGDVNPKFKVFGLEIFNYKLWIALIVLAAISWAALTLKRKS